MSARLARGTAALGAGLLTLVAAAGADSSHTQTTGAGENALPSHRVGFANSSRAGAPRGELAVVAEPDHESGGLNYPSDVYVVDVDGTHLRNLTHDGASNGWAQWMPDGKRVVFQSEPSDPKQGTSHIFVVNSDGTHRRRLTSRIGGDAPELSPDGRRIAFLVQHGNKGAYYVMDANGRNKRRVVSEHGFDSLGGPSWSADGRLLMFERQDCPGGGDCSESLFVMNSNGSGLARLQRSPTLDRAVWSPTRATLALSHYDVNSGAGYLTIADVQRHHGRFVLRPVKKIRNFADLSFAWTPDGRRIISSNTAGSWVVDARRAEPRRRFPVRAIYFWTWSPHGQWLAFSRSRLLRSDPIMVATAAGREPRTVTRKICCLLDEIAWAPR